MMRALTRLGHEVHLLTSDRASDAATEGAGLAQVHCFEDLEEASTQVPGLSYLQRKFQSYWGIHGEKINQVGALAKRLGCDGVVPVGLEVLPYLAAVEGAKRIWYAADEWLYHHLTLMFLNRPSSWSNFKPALVKGLYEFAYSGVTDRVWVVSKADAKAVRWVMPGVKADVIPNGVDTDHFHPFEIERIPKSCTMWGRLDFEPNIDAVRWFSTKVWPELKRQNPDASFDVFGFQPSAEVMGLSRQESFNVIPDLPDLREAVSKREIVVLPFVSGAGIKNKFLEAAAMGKAIIASPRALNGMSLPSEAPVCVANTPEDWIAAAAQLWNDPDEANRLGKLAREWVSKEFSWHNAGCLAEQSFNEEQSNG